MFASTVIFRPLSLNIPQSFFFARSACLAVRAHHTGQCQAGHTLRLHPSHKKHIVTSNGSFSWKRHGSGTQIYDIKTGNGTIMHMVNW